jgi:hypothetical protein
MENNTTIASKLATTFADLKNAVQRFNNVEFNEKPADQNWSPAMVVQHLILAGNGLDQLLLGRTKPTEGAFDQKVEIIKNIFLNFEAKYTSPPFIEPKDEQYGQQQQIEQLERIYGAILAILPNLDLSQTCLDFEFPNMGHLTRLELISFIIYHTQRHTHQLNTIANTMSISYNR